MTNEELAAGKEDARRLGKMWGRNAMALVESGLAPGDVARSLVAVGLELWTKTEGPAAVAHHLGEMADALGDAIGEMEAMEKATKTN